jgi:choline dehydrogenase-like flavoprotein
MKHLTLLCTFLARPVLTLPSLSSRSDGSPNFNEILQAQGLLGSHFGHVNLPAAFDYVVIGGGTAGLTIARRLAESHTVAVIEAGSFYELDNGNFTEIPAYASNYLGKNPLFQNPLVDWRQMTTPQPGFGGASVLYPQGHTLGGGSARNFMWYQRGSTGSYQKWADMVGDESYTFPNLLPFFKTSVQFTPLSSPERTSNSTPLFDESQFSSSGGPLQVSYPKFASPSASWLALGLNAIGLKELPGGMEDGNLLGWSWIANTIDPVLQTRSTSESSMLREALALNDNLVVFGSTLAKKILFNENKEATGVQVETAGVGSGSITYTINATKEVILSAGAFRSPQMLMVSGIGPAATLRSNGIEVLADRPGVGQNMWDHVFFGPSHVVDTVTHNFLGDPAFSAAATEEYIRNRTGILTNVGGDLLGKLQI